MGWTTPRTWVAGEVPTAAIFNTHVRDNLNALNGFVRKTSAESVTSSTTFQDDDELFYTIDDSSARYEVNAYLFVSSAANAAGDIKFQWSMPGGSNVAMGGIGLDIGLASGAVGTLSMQAGSPLSFGCSTTQSMIVLHAIFTPGATGTLTLQWAQNSSSGSATTVQAGSHLVIKQVV